MVCHLHQFSPVHAEHFLSGVSCSSSSFRVPQLELGKPLRPVEQLVAILPPSSAKRLLPPEFAALVGSQEWADIFPTGPNGTSFTLDPNGMERDYQWLVLLPFLSTSVIRDAVARVEASGVSDVAASRNAFGAPAVMGSSAAIADWGATLPGSVEGIESIGDGLQVASLKIPFESDGGVDRYAAVPAAEEAQQDSNGSDSDSDSEGDYGEDSVFGDEDLYTADFADATRQQRFAPLGTLDAIMKQQSQINGCREEAFIDAPVQSAQ